MRLFREDGPTWVAMTKELGVTLDEPLGAALGAELGGRSTSRSAQRWR